MPDSCLERILKQVPARTQANLRLVSKSWRDQVSYTLTKLALTSECGDLETLLHSSFPSIGTLSLTVSRGLPTLEPLSTLSNLTTLAIMGHDVRLRASPIPFSDAALAQIAVIPRLSHLTLVKIAINWAGKSTWLGDLLNLKSLRLRGVKLGNAHQRMFLSGLHTLKGLEALEIDELTFEDCGSSDCSARQKWPEALSKMKHLKEIRLGGSSIPITDDLCCALASLSKLSSLELSRPGWWGSKSSENLENDNTNGTFRTTTTLRLPTLTEDGGLAALAARASTLRHLALCGCFAMTSNAAVHHIAALTSLTSLDFRFYSGEEETPQRHTRISGACLARLTALQHLEHLHLGGWPVSVAFSRTLSRLPSLRRLEFSSCFDLGDSVVFEVARMSKLQHLALRRCVAVSDIGLAALAKGPLAHSLTALDLKGCHKNVTDQGLNAIQGLQKLQLLDISGCELVSDLGIARGLVKMKFLEHLGLSDTRVSDDGCRLLASVAPLLRAVHIEHCSKITDSGADVLARLNRLHEVKAFGSSISARGAQKLSETTGAVVSLYKPCWWTKPSTTPIENIATSGDTTSCSNAGRCIGAASTTTNNITTVAAT
jgi:hypothetical protein